MLPEVEIDALILKFWLILEIGLCQNVELERVTVFTIAAAAVSSRRCWSEMLPVSAKEEEKKRRRRRGKRGGEREREGEEKREEGNDGRGETGEEEE